MANIINGTDTGSGGLITTGDSSDELQLQTAEVARITLTNTAVVVNESGANVDFRVEGGTEANLLFVDASADRVGIGTTSPGARLQVTSAVSGSYGAVIYNTHATGQGLTVRGGSTSSQDAFNVQTYDGNTSLLTVQAGGNVGIGTTSPSVKFEVNGRVLGESVVAGNALYVWSQNRMSLGTSYGIESQQSSPFFLLTNPAQPIVFGTNNTERMRLDASGNVGIGTTSPSAKLHVQGNLRSANAGNTVHTELRNDGVYATGTGLYLLAPSGEPVVFYANDTERMRIISSGNVGIGTTSPNYQLHVTTSFAVGASGFNQQLSFTNDTIQSLLLGTGYTSLKLNPLGGNVGIGTNSPSRQLELSTFLSGAPTGTGFVGGTLRLSNLTAYESNYDSGGGNPDFLGSLEFYSGDTSTGTGVRTAIKTSVDTYYNVNSLCFYTAPANTAGILERMRIDSSGNLLFNSGYGSVATAYGCRAWVNFNGTGTVAIRASGNVSSISDQGTGQYYVNFSTAMPDDDFATSALANYVNGSGIGTTVFLDNSPLTTRTALIVTVALNSNYSVRDCTDVSVAIFR